MKLERFDGQPLSASAERATRRILRAALAVAAEIELVPRNVALHRRPVATERAEVDIPGPEKIVTILEALSGAHIFPLVNLALATGMRRGELLALRWSDVNLDLGTIKVQRTLEKSLKQG